MELREVRYIGTKLPFRVMLPYPFVSLGEKKGEVIFTENERVHIIEEESAKNMIATAPHFFELVPEKQAKKGSVS